MNKPASKLPLIVGLLAVACMLTIPVARAAGDVDKAAKKARKAEGDLKKYDKNGNGKLDPDEEAAMKADQAKAKEKRKKKEEGK